VRARFSGMFDHVLVDEFQDTNRVQSEIVDQMASSSRNLMVVGDDSQSIYSFRGAEFQNIVAFPERYPDAQVARLEINYRSTPQILRLANRSIAKNTQQFAKELRAVRGDGPLPANVRCADENEQAMFIGSRILDLREEDVPLDKIAILYRAHWHSLEVQVALNRLGIPFRVQSGQRFFEQLHIKDLVAFFRFVDNPRDELAFQRVASLADGVGPKSARRLFNTLHESGDPLACLSDASMDDKAPSRARPSWKQVRRLLADLASPSSAKDTAGAIDRVVSQFYEAYAVRTFDNSGNRLREIETLGNYASQYQDRGEFLASLALSGTGAGVDQVAGEQEDESVVLSTIHQAKGLEFAAVFVLWLADDRFPSTRSRESSEDFEEERRLFYVATTRAEHDLYLMVPMRTWDRQQGLVYLRESEFLREIDTPGDAVFERWKVS
jgi:DNA helicase II / ATP-dependent DNA helicase PcrA